MELDKVHVVMSKKCLVFLNSLRQEHRKIGQLAQMFLLISHGNFEIKLKCQTKLFTSSRPRRIMLQIKFINFTVLTARLLN